MLRRRTVFLIGSGLIVALGAGTRWFLAPPQSPPSYPGQRPALEPDGYVSTTHSVFVEAAPEEVYAWASDPSRNLADVVDFEDRFPAVAATVPLTGSELVGERAGFRRRVEFEDGHYLAEEMLVDKPERFQYMIWGFTRPSQRITVHHAVAEFNYLSEQVGTRLSWTYSLMPTSRLLRPALETFVAQTMDPMMTATLAGIRNGVESR